MVRDIIFNRNYTVKYMKEDRLKLVEFQKLQLELKKIGTNFNQMLKHINSKKLNYFTEEDKKNMAINLLEIKTKMNEVNNFLNLIE